MKKILLITLLFCTGTTLFAQDAAGKWSGELDAGGMTLLLNVNVTATDTGYTATMDSPDQGAYDIPLDSFTVEENVVKFKLAEYLVEYEGELKDKTIEGTFTQNSQPMGLNLTKKDEDSEEEAVPEQ